MALGVAGAIGLGTLMPAGAAWIPAEPAPIVRERGQEFPLGETDADTVILWTLGGVGASAVVLGTLYLLKRRVGGFPENPSWVAPITIMYASENATEETFGGPGEAHLHADPHADDHGSHH